MKEIFLTGISELTHDFNKVSNKHELVYEIFSKKEKVIEILISPKIDFKVYTEFRKFQDLFSKNIWRFDGIGNVIINIENGIDEKEISNEWNLMGKEKTEAPELKCFSVFKDDYDMKIKINSSYMRIEEPRMKKRAIAS